MRQGESPLEYGTGRRGYNCLLLPLLHKFIYHYLKLFDFEFIVYVAVRSSLVSIHFAVDVFCSKVLPLQR